MRPRLLTMAGRKRFELRLLCDELLNAHAVVDVADVNRTIFANSNVVTPIDLAIVVAKAAPFGEDFPGKVEFQQLAAIGRTGFQVATVNDIEQIVGADGE